MHAAELGDRIVAVFEEDPLIELVGPFETQGRVERHVAGEIEVTDELVEEQSAQTLGGARVAREQGPLHHLGQVDQREDRTLKIGEVAAQDRHLRVGELFGNVGMHGVTRLEAKLRPRVDGRGPRDDAAQHRVAGF